MTLRQRRLRQSSAIRILTQETNFSKSQLILPVFVREEIKNPVPIISMPGVFQQSLESLKNVVEQAVSSGLGGIMLFGVPCEEKLDANATSAYDPKGILNKATKVARSVAGEDIVIQTDLCLDEFTNHGHCGVLDKNGLVDNDATLPIYGKMAVSQAQSGSQLIGLSGMMDGQVSYVRKILDKNNFSNIPILAYSAKYASGFYGPFREAVNSKLKGDRKTYQINPANFKEGVRRAALDEADGADIVMVKPALPYLDVLREVTKKASVPVWAYQVSGEYAQIEAAAANGWIDRDRVVFESIQSIFRAGANAVLSYYALEVAAFL